MAGFLSKLGVDIGVTGSEIIYHFFCLAFAAVSVIAFFFLLRKGSETKEMFISGAVVLIFTALYLFGYLITNKYMHIFEFIGYVISYLTFAVICGRKVFKRSDKSLQTLNAAAENICGGAFVCNDVLFISLFRARLRGLLHPRRR